MMPRFRLPLVLALVVLACAKSEPAHDPKQAPPQEPAPTQIDAQPPATVTDAKPRTKTRQEIADTVRAAMDAKADPCVDFYRYACGGWLAKTGVPSDKSRWTRSFGVLTEQNREVMHDLLEEAANDPAATGDRAMLGRFYGACMDETAIEAASDRPLRPWLAEIAAVADVGSFMAVAGRLHRVGIRPIFGVRVAPDDKNPGVNIAHVRQGGLGLPDRDYYVDAKRADIRAAYQLHVARMFALLGESEAQAAVIAADVVAFETKLAQKQMTRVERRDPDRTYHKIDLAGIEEQVPALAWAKFAEATLHPEITQINVDSVDYLRAAAELLAKAQPQTLQRYLSWQLVHESAAELPKAFVDADFEFFGKTLRGQQEIEARWKRCTSATERAFPLPLGKLYVERTFPRESKDLALDLIARIEAAFEANLPALSWMNDTTRARAIEKMKAIRNKVGYPDKWRDYSALRLEGTHFDDVHATRMFEYDYEAAKVGKPVDPEEWRSGPPVVNASYSGTRNEMWFPAGVLQAPFFDKDHPVAMNFGGIGMVMGHELTHGFDDQGRKFDAKGTLRQWWEDEVIAEFEKRTSCVADIYSKQEVEPGLHVDGRLTLGENTADLGGLKQTYQAYLKWAAENGGDTEPHVDGLTNDQLLFVSFAQVWCTVATPEHLRVQVATDPHSPAKFRVNVPASMSKDFAAAFACKQGTPMNPKDRCEVW